MQSTDKLYIIVRKDLSFGAKLAQSCHVAFSFSQEHVDITKNWINNSNYIVILEVDNENDLINLLKIADNLQIAASKFKEPNFNMSLTAIALEPNYKSKKLCSNLKLASM